MGEKKTNLFGKIIGKIWGNWAGKEANEWLENLYKNDPELRERKEKLDKQAEDLKKTMEESAEVSKNL